MTYCSLSRLRKALVRLNPHLAVETLEEVVLKLRQMETPSIVEENRRLHGYLIEGVPVDVARKDGSIGGDAAKTDRLRQHRSQQLACGQSIHSN